MAKPHWWQERAGHCWRGGLCQTRPVLRLSSTYWGKDPAREGCKRLIKDRIWHLGLEKTDSSCCLCFSARATTLKYIAVIFPGGLCFSVQCLGEGTAWQQGSNFVGLKLIFCQNASLNCHFLLSLEFFRKCWQHFRMLNIKAVVLGCCQLLSAGTRRFWWLSCYSLAQLSRKIEWSSSFCSVSPGGVKQRSFP